MRHAVSRESSGIRTHMAGPRTYVWLRVISTPPGMWTGSARLKDMASSQTLGGNRAMRMDRLRMAWALDFDLNSGETTR